MSVFPSEDLKLAERRKLAVQAIRVAIRRLTEALERGYLWEFETKTPHGISGVARVEETPARRQARLETLARDLVSLATRLESEPIPKSWLDRIRIGSDENAHWTVDGGRMFATTIDDVPARYVWLDAVIFYHLHAVDKLNRDADQAFNNIDYLDTRPIPKKIVARVPVAAGVATGICIAVPDPEDRPLEYRRVWKNEPLEGQGVLIEVERDGLGYYYRNHEAKHYLPGRPEIQ